MTDDSTNPNLEPVPPESPWPVDPSAAADPTVAAAPAGDPTLAAPVVAAGPPGDEPPSKPSWKTWVAVASIAAVVGAAAVFGISAATSSDSSDAAVATNGSATQNGQGSTTAPGGQGGSFTGRPGGFGTISSINGTSLEMKDQQGTTTKVVTTDSTKVTKTVTGSVDDVKVGDTVMVVGTGSDTAITATQVTDNGKVADDATGQGGPGFRTNGNGNGYGPPQGFGGYGPPGGFTGNGNGAPNGAQGQAPNGAQGPGGASGMGFTRGVVKSVADGKIVVTSRDSTEVTVTTSSDTKFSVTQDAKVSDLKVGESIVVVGDSSNGTLTATSIREGVNRPAFGNRRGTNGGAGNGGTGTGSAPSGAPTQ